MQRFLQVARFLKKTRMLSINVSIPNRAIARRCAVSIVATPFTRCNVTAL